MQAKTGEEIKGAQKLDSRLTFQTVVMLCVYKMHLCLTKRGQVKSVSPQTSLAAIYVFFGNFRRVAFN